MTVRRLGPGDEAILAEIERTLGNRADALDTGRFLDAPGSLVFIAEEKGVPVARAYGHELAHPKGARTLFLYAIDVSERARRKGHGRALVGAFLAHAREQRMRELWVLTDAQNIAAQALYAASGGRREPLDQLMFVWDLPRVSGNG
jgi:ribosomal protein S18 acetylase RimI-like enzyme